MITKIDFANRVVILSVLFLLTASLGGRAFTQRSYHGSYVYIPSECTGPNQFIIFDGRESEIHVKSAGDPTYRKLLRALSWRIMSPQENRGKVVLVGTYKPATKEFLLERWYWRGNVSVIYVPNLQRSQKRIYP